MALNEATKTSPVSPRKKMATGVYPRFGTTAKNPGASTKGSLPVAMAKNQVKGPMTSDEDMVEGTKGE